jgi:hypothetical protein
LCRVPCAIVYLSFFPEKMLVSSGWPPPPLEVKALIHALVLVAIILRARSVPETIYYLIQDHSGVCGGHVDKQLTVIKADFFAVRI